jgi:hypothetical protein
MLPLHDTLLLFALHDDKGTVQASAFLALDHALRGAVLSELRLKGHVQTRADGVLRLAPIQPASPVDPVMEASLGAVRSATSSGPCAVSAALDAIQRALPDIRDEVVSSLTARGILRNASVERMGLPSDVVHPMANGRIEAAARAQLGAALASGDDIRPRDGLLLALTVAAHLEGDVFADAEERARERADWVAERDSIVRAVREAVELVEGW